MGKRPSFTETATNRLRFLVDEQGFLGPEIEKDKFVPGISTVRYHRSDITIEVVHVVGPMGEAYVQTRCRRETDKEQGDLTHLGRNTTHTGYQLRRAVDLQADAVCSYLGLTRQRITWSYRSGIGGGVGLTPTVARFSGLACRSAASISQTEPAGGKAGRLDSC